MRLFFYMKIKHSYCLLINLALLFSTAQAQTQIEIINADKIVYKKKINEDRQVLTGNVRTKHEDRYLNCDSAYFYANDNRIEAFSTIKIWQGDTLELEGDYLIYHGNHHLAEMQNNVKFKHNEMTLQSEDLNFNFTSNEGYFDTRGTITHQNKSLSSRKGIYYTNEQKFDFYGDVTVLDEKETLEADSLEYWLNTEIATFSSNGIITNEDFEIKAQNGWINRLKGAAKLSNSVEITQLKDGTKLYADTCLISDDMNKSISYGNVLVHFPFEEDTFHLTADTLISDQNLNTIKAYYKVYFKSEALSGQSDSLTYNSDQKIIYLNYEPVLWMEEFQLTADSIKLILEDKKIKRALLNSKAFILSSIDSVSANQISGLNMKANFENNKLTSINVMGNGESIYYVVDDETDENIGLNKIICSNMFITMEENSLKNIKFFEQPTATMYPIKDVTTEIKLLKNYKYFNKGVIATKIENKTK